MKKILLLMLMCLLALTTFSTSLITIVDRAKEVNPNYVLSELNSEKAELDYEKAMIEAMNEKMELAAEINKFSGDQQVLRNLTDFYAEILDDIFTVKTQKLDKQIKALNVEIAKKDYEDKKDLFDKDLVSENDLTDASLTYQDAQSSLSKSEKDLQVALDTFKRDTSLDYDEVDLFVPEYEKILVSKEEWVDANISVKIASDNVDIASYDKQNLSSNASKYQKKLADINLKQKEIDMRLAVISAEDQKQNFEDTLDFLKEQLETLDERVGLVKDNLDDIKTRYKKGLVSETELNNQEIAYLNQLNQYYSTLNSYWTTLSNYLLNSDSDLEELIRNEIQQQEAKNNTEKDG